MRLLVTADLHYNHPRSRAVADELIDEMNRAGGDVLLLVGDTAVADGDSLEQCLARFRFRGPKLFVPGNHELWTLAHGNSHTIFTDDLPRRVRALGWHWLQGEPFRTGTGVGIAGSIGWYDYAFAPPELHIPRRFYEHKVSPGAAERLSEYAHLFDGHADDVTADAREVVARWNDSKFVKLHRSDDAFLAELLSGLRAQLESLRDLPRVIAAIHHLPYRELLPPPRNAQWDFAKAFLGSPQFGALLNEFPNVQSVYCGHSHFAADATVGHVHAVNIGSGYRAKTFKTVELE